VSLTFLVTVACDTCKKVVDAKVQVEFTMHVPGVDEFKIPLMKFDLPDGWTSETYEERERFECASCTPDWKK
jgi:hypothetical protein